MSLFPKKTNKSYCWKHRLEWTCWLSTKPCHPPFPKQGNVTAAQANAAIRLREKSSVFFVCRKSQKKIRWWRKISSGSKNTDFFFQKGDRKPNQFSTNSLCLNCFFNQFSILAKMILYSSHPTSTKKRLRKIEWSECLKKTSDPSMKKLFLVSTSRNIYIYMYLLYQRTLVACFPHQVYLCLKSLQVPRGSDPIIWAVPITIDPFIWPTFFWVGRGG